MMIMTEEGVGGGAGGGEVGGSRKGSSTNWKQIPFRKILLINLIFTGYFYPLNLYQYLTSSSSSVSKDYEDWLIGEAIVGAVGLVLSWVYYVSALFIATEQSLQGSCQEGDWKSATAEYWKYLSQSCFPVLILIYLISGLIRRTLAGDCANLSNMENWNAWLCNPYQSIDHFPVENGFLAVSVPVVMMVLLKEERWYMIWMSWVVAVASLVVASILVGSTRTVPTVLLFVIGSALLMMEFGFLQQLCSCSYTLLEEKVANNRLLEEAAIQSKEKEMRNMIANVAHDLKTPLSSFMTGIDIINRDLDELGQKLNHNNNTHHRAYSMTRSSLTSFDSASTLDLRVCTDVSASGQIDALKVTVQNIKHTNAFMLMTINRCLDYAKATNGLKLTPKYETIDLQETLALPLNCMMNIQQKVKITLEAYNNSSTEICTHILTDKQWLQENILCLLSNAVKYSSGGDVKILVSLQPRPNTRDTMLTTDSNPTEEIAQVVASYRNGGGGRQNNNNSIHTNTGRSYNSVNSSSLRNTSRMMADFTFPYSSTTVREAKISPHAAPSFSSYSSSYSTSFVSPPASPSVYRSRNHQVNSPENEMQENYSEVLLFEIMDQGIGMSDEAMSSLFSPFKQTQRLAGGTGLGLYSLSKRIEALKGQYGVKRREDGQQGSVFWFSIPYRPDKVVANIAKRFALLSSEKRDPSQRSTIRRLSSGRENMELYSKAMEAIDEYPKISEDRDLTSVIEAASVSASDSGRKKSKTRPLNILLAEDTSSIAKMTVMMLQKMGHTVTLAENGEIALNLLTQSYQLGVHSEKSVETFSLNDQSFTRKLSPATATTSYDVVLMDLQMPVMDGLEATRRLREYERNLQSSAKLPSLPHQLVFGVTAAMDEEAFEDGRNVGMDDFIPKPFSMEAFTTKLDSILSMKDGDGTGGNEK